MRTGASVSRYGGGAGAVRVVAGRTSCSRGPGAGSSGSAVPIRAAATSAGVA